MQSIFIIYYRHENRTLKYLRPINHKRNGPRKEQRCRWPPCPSIVASPNRSCCGNKTSNIQSLKRVPFAFLPKPLVVVNTSSENGWPTTSICPQLTPNVIPRKCGMNDLDLNYALKRNDEPSAMISTDSLDLITPRQQRSSA